MSEEDEVRKASEAFYAALDRMGHGEKGAMEDAWSHDPGVTAMHPIGGRVTGWEAVRDSFDRVAEIASDATISLREQSIRVLGDAAFELGIEHGALKLAGREVGIEHRVTNVYRREAGGWKLVHHHADLSPAMVDVLKRLRPS